MHKPPNKIVEIPGTKHIFSDEVTLAKAKCPLQKKALAQNQYVQQIYEGPNRKKDKKSPF